MNSECSFRAFSFHLLFRLTKLEGKQELVLFISIRVCTEAYVRPHDGRPLIFSLKSLFELVYAHQTVPRIQVIQNDENFFQSPPLLLKNHWLSILLLFINFSAWRVSWTYKKSLSNTLLSLSFVRLSARLLVPLVWSTPENLKSLVGLSCRMDGDHQLELVSFFSCQSTKWLERICEHV